VSNFTNVLYLLELIGLGLRLKTKWIGLDYITADLVRFSSQIFNSLISCINSIVGHIYTAINCWHNYIVFQKNGTKFTAPIATVAASQIHAVLAKCSESNCLREQDNVHTNTESVQCISIVYSICLYKYNQLAV